MKKLSVNIDHIATLRQARREEIPDPVHAAVLAELGGADGITVHLRKDRRHINERDLELLRKIVKTELNLEMAATSEMVKIALEIKPDIVTLVPERPEEVTTEGGLNIKRNYRVLEPIAQKIKSAGIRLSFFTEADQEQIAMAQKLGADLIEINTNLYSKEKKNPTNIISRISEHAQFAKELGLLVHCGHGINYQNIIPLLRINEISGFSIGFAIIARAVYVGLTKAVYEMKEIINRYSNKE
ncbi:MAG: pyridoxine 5'-phosphate synthase [candidate division WOR-3 bacterium]|nr:pyridoxine 5'-phosphate synthase [candidate division WOR-3 bacterium]